MSKRIPVTVITGFLGAGKTTVLRSLILNSGQKLAVMVNEFGSVGLDGDLIRSCGFCPEDEVEGRLVELNNGCLCCTVQEDFLPTMNKLLSRPDDLEGIVIETSGLALPRPLLQALEWPAIRTKVHLNSVITLVDGEALSKGSPVGDLIALEEQRADDPSLDHMTSVEELFSNQLKVADLVLISRADLLSSLEIESLQSKLFLKVREGTNILPVGFGEVNPEIILGVNQSFENELNISSSNKDDPHDHRHLEVSTNTLRIEGIVNKQQLEALLPQLTLDYQIIRLKGRCWIEGKSLPLQIQMVGPRYNSWFEAAPQKAWRPATSGIDLVIISFNSKAAEAVLEKIKETCLT